MKDVYGEPETTGEDRNIIPNFGYCETGEEHVTLQYNQERDAKNHLGNHIGTGNEGRKG